ncbi:helix-turn-helix transcriptional regulator [Enterococcus sp. AZ101]|uniref:helix-turn-helix transcriptional regulator n=1 Tax=Enterococcus sp. AZ101 TaxID=2774742 RepID=UPI003D271F57
MFKKKEPVYLSRLGTIRLAKGFTVQTLAKTVGVSKETIRSIELGKHKLSLELAYEISGALDCRTEEVFPRIGGE